MSLIKNQLSDILFFLDTAYKLVGPYLISWY